MPARNTPGPETHGRKGPGPQDRQARAFQLGRRPMHPAARTQRLDMLIGILGFFTLAAFVVAAAAELRGGDVARQVLVLVLFLALLGVALRARYHRP